MTKMKMKTALALVAVLAALPAFAGTVSGGATELTQLANHAELVASYGKQAESVAEQIQMYENMLTNTTQLPVQGWSSVSNNLTSLVNLISNVRGLVSVTGDTLAATQKLYGNGEALSDYQNRLKDWNTGLNNQIGTALQAIGQNANQFQTRAQALQQIENMSQSATGRMQALQAGNQIAGMMVNELQSLHSTMIAADQAQLNAIQVGQNEKYQDDQRLKNWLETEPQGGW